jgi:hypothetical protein
MKIQIAYLHDESRKERLNKQGRNYWFEYLKEVLCQLGISGREISPKALGIKEEMSEIKVLFIGSLNLHDYGIDIVRNIDDWVAKGGMLIGFATEGLDNIFGNTYQSDIKQPIDDFTISGYFAFEKTKLTQGIHSVIAPSQKLLVFSDIRAVTTNQSEQIAGLHLKKDAQECASAVTINHYGKGWAIYFSFDVAKTFWVLHHGKPVYKGRRGTSNRWWIRTTQKTVIGDNSDKVGYADEVLFLLQNIIALTKYPFIYQIPPKDNEVPVALFHWAGDDEGDSTGIQLKASNWMKEKGLPYHINAMEVAGRKIPLSKEDALKIIKNGHEISCHYNFTIYDGKEKKSDKNNPLMATESEVKRQSKLFKDKFGLPPLAGATHCVIWYGGSEPAKWMAEEGGIANNNFTSPNPIFNGSNLSFGFGTSYPYYFYDDAKNKNKRIDFMEIPITGYELGHKATSGGDKMEVDLPEVYMAVDIASYYHLIFNMFYHPYYIHEESGARKAIEGFLGYIDKNGITVIHMGANAMAKWWNERARSRISNVTYHKDTLSFDAFCLHKGGMVIKIPIDNSEGVALMVDNDSCKFEEKNEFGYEWLYFICPYGSHRIRLLTKGG